uniref:Uncharacterized protein n=1 Tax=Heterorhabditis bacteriophora TaxID=37862 RepID=A0A1I7WUN1_HETBA
MAQYYGGVSGLVDSVWSCIYPVISSIGGLNFSALFPVTTIDSLQSWSHRRIS